MKWRTTVSDLMSPDLQTQLEEEEPVIREGSLKVGTCSPPLALAAPAFRLEFEGLLMFQAWKLEQERLQKEEEEEKTKKAKSEPKGKPQEAAKPADARKGSSSSSAGQKRGAEPAEAPPAAVSSSSRSSTQEQKPRSSSPPPCVQAFVGLNTGGLLIRPSGRVQHLRPSDGGVVTVEDIRYAEGMSRASRRLEASRRRSAAPLPPPQRPGC